MRTFSQLLSLLILTAVLVIDNQAFAQRADQANPVDASFYKNYNWRNIGPNRGGRSLGSSGSPGRTNEYYFGATGGGLVALVKGI